MVFKVLTFHFQVPPTVATIRSNSTFQAIHSRMAIAQERKYREESAQGLMRICKSILMTYYYLLLLSRFLTGETLPRNYDNIDQNSLKSHAHLH